MTGYPILFIGDTQPGGSPSDGWVWVDTANKVIRVFEGYADGSWVEKPLSLPVPVTLEENLTFLSNIYAGEKKGINANITLADGTKLKFHKGILWKVEEP